MNFMSPQILPIPSQNMEQVTKPKHSHILETAMHVIEIHVIENLPSSPASSMSKRIFLTETYSRWWFVFF